MKEGRSFSASLAIQKKKKKKKSFIHVACLKKKIGTRFFPLSGSKNLLLQGETSFLVFFTSSVATLSAMLHTLSIHACLVRGMPSLKE